MNFDRIYSSGGNSVDGKNIKKQFWMLNPHSVVSATAAVGTFVDVALLPPSGVNQCSMCR